METLNEEHNQTSMLNFMFQSHYFNPVFLPHLPKQIKWLSFTFPEFYYYFST